MQKVKEYIKERLKGYNLNPTCLEIIKWGEYHKVKAYFFTGTTIDCHQMIDVGYALGMQSLEDMDDVSIKHTSLNLELHIVFDMKDIKCQI